MDLQHLNILFHVFHGFVVAGDFALYDEMVVENMEAGNLIAMLDDAYLKICSKTICWVSFYFLNLNSPWRHEKLSLPLENLKFKVK